MLSLFAKHNIFRKLVILELVGTNIIQDVNMTRLSFYVEIHDNFL